jgi:hypothetical protein
MCTSEKGLKIHIMPFLQTTFVEKAWEHGHSCTPMKAKKMFNGE